MMILNNNVFFSIIYCFVYVWKVFIISNLSSFLFGKIEGKLFIIVKFLNVLVQMIVYLLCLFYLMRWWCLRDLKIYECFVYIYINVDIGLYLKLKIKGIYIKFGIF